MGSCRAFGFSLWHLPHAKKAASGPVQAPQSSAPPPFERLSSCGNAGEVPCLGLFRHTRLAVAWLIVCHFCTRLRGRRWRSLKPRSREIRSRGSPSSPASPPTLSSGSSGAAPGSATRPGEPILDYLDASDDVFFITLGEVRVTIYSSVGKAVSFRELAAGEIFGEFPAIDGGSRSASVEARTNCLIASMPGSSFRELLQSEPGLAQALLPRLVKTIRALTTRVYEFSTLAVNNRIQAELLRLASLGPKEGKSARIVPAPTHVEIASRVSTHREAVTRELNRLSRIGIIERRGGTLLVKDVDRLAEMVHDATGE